MGQKNSTSSTKNGFSGLKTNSDGSSSMIFSLQEFFSEDGEQIFHLSGEQLENYVKDMIRNKKDDSEHHLNQSDAEIVQEGGIRNIFQNRGRDTSRHIENAWLCDLTMDNNGNMIHSGTPRRIMVSMKVSSVRRNASLVTR